MRIVGDSCMDLGILGNMMNRASLVSMMILLLWLCLVTARYFEFVLPPLGFPNTVQIELSQSLISLSSYLDNLS